MNAEPQSVPTLYENFVEVRQEFSLGEVVGIRLAMVEIDSPTEYFVRDAELLSPAMAIRLSIFLLREACRGKSTDEIVALHESAFDGMALPEPTANNIFPFRASGDVALSVPDGSCSGESTPPLQDHATNAGLTS